MRIIPHEETVLLNMCSATQIAFVTAGTIVAFYVADRQIAGCENDHPPIISRPKIELVVSNQHRKPIVAVSIDQRGIGGVALSGEAANTWIDPSDPTGEWHYREWQWWKGHPWGDSCRPRYYADVQFHPRLRDDSGAASSRYRIDGFDCRQVFLLPTATEGESLYWDIVTTIRNVSGHHVEEYGQFFACYTPLNRKRSFWYWDESRKLVLFADRGVKHLDGYVANPNAFFLKDGAIPHCPRGGGRVVGRWHRPVMISQASPTGWRSIVLLDAKYTASLAQGIEGGATDYNVYPSSSDPVFTNGAKFSAHIRHVMLRSPTLPTLQRLEELWSDFELSHEALCKRAAQL